MSLYPTPARLERLRDVADGEVHRYGDGQDYAHGHQKVTSVMAAMQREGWVRLSTDGPPHKQRWVLTPAGLATLTGSGD